MRTYLITLTTKERNGILSLMMETHAYACPSWRIGKRYGPCDCGGKARYDALVKKLKGGRRA